MKRLIMAATAAIVAAGCCDKKDDGAAKADDALTVIATRTSVRSYDTSREVTDAEVEQLLRAGMAAPTAVNAQPWEFIVVKDREMLKALAAAHPHSQMSQTAGCAIVVCGIDNGLEGEAKEFWIQDCSAATENILLAAHAMGMGAVWCGVHPLKERVAAIKSVLGIPYGAIPLNIINIGHIKAPSKPKDKWKPQKIHYNKW